MLSTLSINVPHINQHRGSSVPVVDKAWHINHTGVSRTCRQPQPLIYTGSILPSKPAPFLITTTAPQVRKPKTLPRHLPNKAATSDAKPHNVRNAIYPKIKIEQPHTTNNPPHSVHDTIGPKHIIINCQVKQQSQIPLPITVKVKRQSEYHFFYLEILGLGYLLTRAWAVKRRYNRYSLLLPSSPTQ